MFPIIIIYIKVQNYSISSFSAQRDIEQVTGLIPSVPIQSTSSSSNRELRLSGSLPGAELDLAPGADMPQVDLLRALTQMITPQQVHLFNIRLFFLCTQKTLIGVIIGFVNME